tara:strand:- start:257 stop:436 length:180 start_codon:yes stop_codon:yes gene_type:complete
LVESKYTVFLSAHCVPANEFWLDSLIGSIEKNNKIVAAYGRQIPTNLKTLLGKHRYVFF